METLKLVTTREAVAVEIHEKLTQITAMAGNQSFAGMAVVIVKSDGTTFVSTIGRGNRVHLLGAVTDLQYTIAKDGD